MNREIKFRAWNKVENIMIYFDQFFVGASRIPTPPAYPIGRWEDCIPMQYTGLKDKNGKEIYEGDLISCQRIGYAKRDKKIVFFTDGMFTANESGNETRCSTPIVGIKCEIIGNIYENNDLLTNEK